MVQRVDHLRADVVTQRAEVAQHIGQEGPFSVRPQPLRVLQDERPRPPVADEPHRLPEQASSTSRRLLAEPPASRREVLAGRPGDVQVEIRPGRRPPANVRVDAADNVVAPEERPSNGPTVRRREIAERHRKTAQGDRRRAKPGEVGLERDGRPQHIHHLRPTGRRLRERGAGGRRRLLRRERSRQRQRGREERAKLRREQNRRRRRKRRREGRGRQGQDALDRRNVARRRRRRRRRRGHLRLTGARSGREMMNRDEGDRADGLREARVRVAPARDAPQGTPAGSGGPAGARLRQVPG